uniref:NADH:flavin oxidoreductase/NADH oxidase N-terminal domain-containing protein n=1 Tax=Chromera velia CCMP2878 TaxID=1169474 RepID=A0A0G4HGU1_9ALVE|eukprot:Cvel_27389.t1-p1 / transcript=Cvel_27389.t1 / gene=Cvel_27389 / organism=Chromera_velia_CCMP2878 / gene_product=N-ethylmaleimide reductase, putative / transcript_product=N-ethylmaleimide reductase, putative / location=Cvel_scaffold3410:3375-7574(+) / protein_length=393 / sequence_SO=supercontig / SO=protein_coding / is_pseudo=false
MALLSPLKLSPLQLKNRVVLAPMTRARAGPSRVANELMAEYYSQRAGAGLLITEATAVSEGANGWNDSPGIYTDEMERAWANVTDKVHRAGGVIFVQLWHTGRTSHSSFHDGRRAVSASAVKIGTPGAHAHTPRGKERCETPRALRTDEVREVVNEFRAATARAKRAGFDGVEVHAASGFLLDCFLQSRTNLRADEYGGSVAARCRLVEEVVAACSEEWGNPGGVGVRISPNGSYNDMGSPDFREQFLFLAERLEKFKETQLCEFQIEQVGGEATEKGKRKGGLAYLAVVDGEKDTDAAFKPFHGLGNGTPLTMSEFRQVFTGNLMANCGYSQDSAEAAVQSGQCDLVAFGRLFLSNPDLVERFHSKKSLNPTPSFEFWWDFARGAEGYIHFP